jgi:hypothetical protein
MSRLTLSICRMRVCEQSLSQSMTRVREAYLALTAHTNVSRADSQRLSHQCSLSGNLAIPTLEYLPSSTVSINAYPNLLTFGSLPGRSCLVKCIFQNQVPSRKSTTSSKSSLQYSLFSSLQSNSHCSLRSSEANPCRPPCPGSLSLLLLITPLSGHRWKGIICPSTWRAVGGVRECRIPQFDGIVCTCKEYWSCWNVPKSVPVLATSSGRRTELLIEAHDHDGARHGSSERPNPYVLHARPCAASSIHIPAK